MGLRSHSRNRVKYGDVLLKNSLTQYSKDIGTVFRTKGIPKDDLKNCIPLDLFYDFGPKIEDPTLLFFSGPISGAKAH